MLVLLLLPVMSSWLICLRSLIFIAHRHTCPLLPTSSPAKIFRSFLSTEELVALLQCNRIQHNQWPIKPPPPSLLLLLLLATSQPPARQ
jgi:hypothetical protein